LEDGAGNRLAAAKIARPVPGRDALQTSWIPLRRPVRTISTLWHSEQCYFVAGTPTKVKLHLERGTTIAGDSASGSIRRSNGGRSARTAPVSMIGTAQPTCPRLRGPGQQNPGTPRRMPKGDRCPTCHSRVQGALSEDARDRSATMASCGLLSLGTTRRDWFHEPYRMWSDSPGARTRPNDAPQSSRSSYHALRGSATGAYPS
jgi:hypothetical protein